VAFGGAIYAAVPAAAFGLRVDAGALPELIAAGRAVKAGLDAAGAAEHPTDPRLSGVYGTILWEEVAPGHQRNVTVFADGEVDRSPCGSGTCARVALLDLPEGAVLRHESIIGTTFLARAAERTDAGVVVEVEGAARRTGEHRFVLEDGDEVGEGFVLR
jgi:proline racemase/trans-L-3-hydroxyproline dehydratase